MLSFFFSFRLIKQSSELLTIASNERIFFTPSVSLIHFHPFICPFCFSIFTGNAYMVWMSVFTIAVETNCKTYLASPIRRFQFFFAIISERRRVFHFFCIQHFFFPKNKFYLWYSNFCWDYIKKDVYTEIYTFIPCVFAFFLNFSNYSDWNPEC